MINTEVLSTIDSYTSLAEKLWEEHYPFFNLGIIDPVSSIGLMIIPLIKKGFIDGYVCACIDKKYATSN